MISDYIITALHPSYLEVDKDILVDEVSSSLAYIGKAPAASPTSSARWSISRISKQGNIVEVKYLDSGKFSQIWDNRTTLFGVPPFSNASSIRFNGVNSYLAAPASANLSFERTAPFSISVWVKLVTNSTTQFFVAKRENAGNVRGWQASYSGGVGTQFVLSSTNVGNRIVATGPALTIGVWYHLVWTYQGNSSVNGVKHYINGVNTALTSTENTLTGTIVNSVTTQLGAREGLSGASFFSGYMDEPAIYNIELNQGQVNTIYNSGVPRDLAQLTTGVSLVSWWRMGDGDTYPSILDHKGSNHMTMYNLNNSDIVTDVP